MHADPIPPARRSLTSLIVGRTGQPGRVALACALTGAVLAGGVLVAGASIAGRVSGSSLVPLAGLFLVAGGFVGFMHGAALGLVGRVSDLHWSDAFRSIGFGALLAVPSMALAGLTALWIALTPVAVTEGLRDPMWIFVIGGWLAGTALFVWATAEVFAAAANALVHWPHRRLGTPLVAGTFLVLLVAFVLTQPEIWFTDIEVNTLGAVLLALGATVWIGLPLEVLVLRLVQGPSPSGSG